MHTKLNARSQQQHRVRIVFAAMSVTAMRIRCSTCLRVLICSIIPYLSPAARVILKGRYLSPPVSLSSSKRNNLGLSIVIQSIKPDTSSVPLKRLATPFVYASATRAGLTFSRIWRMSKENVAYSPICNEIQAYGIRDRVKWSPRPDERLNFKHAEIISK